MHGGSRARRPSPPSPLSHRRGGEENQQYLRPLLDPPERRSGEHPSALGARPKSERLTRARESARRGQPAAWISSPTAREKKDARRPRPPADSPPAGGTTC